MQAEKDNDGNKDMRIQSLLSKSQRSFDGIIEEVFYNNAMMLKVCMRNLES